MEHWAKWVNKTTKKEFFHSSNFDLDSLAFFVSCTASCTKESWKKAAITQPKLLLIAEVF